MRASSNHTTGEVPLDDCSYEGGADPEVCRRTNDPAAVLPLSPVGLVAQLPADAAILNPARSKLLILLTEYDRYGRSKLPHSSPVTGSR